MPYKYHTKFDSSVISYGTKTEADQRRSKDQFESNVISCGTKTYERRMSMGELFESSVISYGNKTLQAGEKKGFPCLRVV